MRARSFSCAVVLLAGAPLLAGEQERDQPSPRAPTAREVVPGARYKAGGLHRFVFGGHYRSLWNAPLTAEVLDLRTFSGGLTPRKKGGGKQTKSLKFEGADGRQWKFRSLDKDPSAVLPVELRGTFVEAIVQDQISAANPAGPLVSDALSAAAGIPYVPHRLVILPDDPLLGPFRAEFGNLLGLLEEEIRIKEPVTPGFEAYARVLDTDELWKRLDAHPEEKVDARALLRARLFDMFLGDFDRHKNQWQWGHRRQGDLWEPIPEDRDQAFAKYDGLALWLVRPSQPDLVDFQAHYPSIYGLTRTGRFIDRRHLSELDWVDWEPVVKDLQARLTDAVIDAAVGQLPPAHQKLGGALLARRLKGRRDLLPRAAREFYGLLAREVEIHGSDAAESVDITPGEDGTVTVTVAGEDGQTHYRRSFRRHETHEVRLHLKGGADHVQRAAGTTGILVRVVGGTGDDVLDDTRSGHTRFYDDSGADRVQAGAGTHWDHRPYAQPPDATGNPARDWGHAVLGTPVLGGGGDLGLFLGARVSLVGYGFRTHPYSLRHTLSGGWATGLSAAQGEYEGDYYRANSHTHGHLSLRASQIDILRFYGQGNETAAPEEADFFRVEQRHLMVAPSVHLGTEQVDLELGLVASHSRTPTPGGTFIGTTRPYGVGDFGQAGLRTRLTLGRRDIDRGASGEVWAGGAYYPKLWDVEEAFGNVEGQAAAFLAPRAPLSPVLGLRVGAKKVFGRFPFFESAFVGGPDQVRGLRPQRYAGEAALFGSAELHVQLGEVGLLLPTKVGLLGLADAGRVWVADEASDKWHTGFGGGIWLAPLKRSTSLELALARSEGKTRFYIQAGFGF